MKTKLNWAPLLIAIICFIFGGGVGTILSSPSKRDEVIVETINEVSKLVLSDEEIPVVELVDEAKPISEGGQGYAIDVSSVEAVKDALIGKCIDLDNAWGSQCWDVAAIVSENQVGKRLTTCGTGKAKDMMKCASEQSDGYSINWDPNNIKVGEISVFEGGEFGHVGIALSEPENGYIYLLGANQGGEPCDGGGAAVNIIKKSLKDYVGGYLWNEWEVDESPITPYMPETGCLLWHLEHGDTMSKIMLECENTVVYGKAMDDYAKTWYSLIYKPGQSVYDGWYHSANGVGLYEGDDIEHRTEE